MSWLQLPLQQHKTEFFERLADTPLLIEAEPGAGKSTLIPLWLLETCPANKQIWLIQPRILAVHSLAKRLTSLANDIFKEDKKTGERVGYQVPYDQQLSSDTQLVLMTPGILLQYLLRDPALSNVHCVILDEIHERSVNQDLAFAFLQDTIVLREDLQLVLMSATPDPNLQKQITNRLFAPGRVFPVSIDYLPAKKISPTQTESLANQICRALEQVDNWQQKTCLVFLPGWRDIEKTRQSIIERWPQQAICCLHSQIDYQEQQHALDPLIGPRIILSTNIAETSLTIPDVNLVIDSGLARRVNYEQSTGLSSLRTGLINRASADQRRGRAGRVQAGQCIRLWSADAQLAASDLPEIRASDYFPLVVKLAHWGTSADQLSWIEKPNSLAIAFAQQQLIKMQLLDEQGKITPQGKQVADLGCHPRVAAILLANKNIISDELLLLTLLIHFESSLQSIDWLEQARNQRQKNAHWKIQQSRWLQRLKLSVVVDPIPAETLATAYADRIGYKQSSGKYRLNSGISVESVGTLNSDWAVFPIIDSVGSINKGLGFALNLTKFQQKQFSQLTETVVFKKHWCKHQSWLIGGVLVDESIEALKPGELPGLLTAHITQIANAKGLTSFNWSDSAKNLLNKSRILQEKNLLDLPSLSETGLIQSLGKWLAPFLTPDSSPENFPWQSALEYYLGHQTCEKIHQLIPSSIVLPSGRDVKIQINEHNQLLIAAKLQEFFGCEQLILAQGKIPLQIHLLSPNGSPLAITTDLASFWKQSYPDVCKEMRGRYPRHPWPDDPLAHQATALTKRKLQSAP